MNLLNLAAFEMGEFCNITAEILQIIGYVVLIVKIAIPILIICLGVFDFGKAVVAEKEDEIKKQTKRLIMRVVAGIVIFLIPSLVMWVFEMIHGYGEASESADFDACSNCILRPGSQDCKDAVIAGQS